MIAALALAVMALLPAAGAHDWFASGTQGASGSTIGPGRALYYVTEGATGSVLRVDPSTGETSTDAMGLPTWVIPGVGDAVDVAFIGKTADVLVTMVGPDLGGTSTVGIYQVDGPGGLGRQGAHGRGRAGASQPEAQQDHRVRSPSR